MNLPITLPQPTTQLSPEAREIATHVASGVLGKIDHIAKAIEDSNYQLSLVNDRTWLKQFVSSTSKDLVRISSGQNKINTFMLELIGEAINLNVMSYSVLAVMIEEVQRGAHHGYKTADGHVHKLSQVGKDMAGKAVQMFNKILDGSKSTQDAIRVNREELATLREGLLKKSETDDEQWLEIDQLAESLEAESGRIDALANSMQVKETVDVHQSERLDAQDRAIATLRESMTGMQEALQALQSQVAVVQGQRRPALWVVAIMASAIGAVAGYGISLFAA